MKTTDTTRRTADQANYALNRRPVNRRIYAEQQEAWAYADLLKVQEGLHTARTEAGKEFCRERQVRLEQNLAKAHANLDALQTGQP
jgi:hypothetical protein